LQLRKTFFHCRGHFVALCPFNSLLSFPCPFHLSSRTTFRCLYPFYDLHISSIVDLRFHYHSYLIPRIIIWLGDHMMRLVNTTHTSLYYTATSTISAPFLIPPTLPFAILSSNDRCVCNNNLEVILLSNWRKGMRYRSQARYQSQNLELPQPHIYIVPRTCLPITK